MCGGSNLSTVLARWGIYRKKCISLVRIRLQTRKPRNASAKFRKTLESKKAEKSLEISAFLVFSCMHLNHTLILAGDERFELPHTESESAVLPLHKSPKFCSERKFIKNPLNKNYYNTFQSVCQGVFENFQKKFFRDKLNKSSFRRKRLEYMGFFCENNLKSAFP